MLMVLAFSGLQGVEMTSTLLYPVVQLAHIAKDAYKVMENFEQMLEVDVAHNESLSVNGIS